MNDKIYIEVTSFHTQRKILINVDQVKAMGADDKGRLAISVGTEKFISVELYDDIKSKLASKITIL